MPQIIIDDKSILEFGDFKLSFQHVPGHSDCSMLITINDKYHHVGDLYMVADNGVDSLPFLYWDGIKEHIKSLELIKALEGQILLSHGFVKDNSVFAEGVENRLLYLNNILSSDNLMTAEEAVMKASKPFAYLDWRAYIKKSEI